MKAWILLIATVCLVHFAACEEEPEMPDETVEVTAPEDDAALTEQQELRAQLASMDRLNIEPEVAGRVAYEAYCKSCHGDEAKGDGELASELGMTPPDLTRLVVNNNDNFPEEAIRKMVDGREVVPAHGTRQMPIWGNIWVSADGDSLQEAVVVRRIDNLIAYLKTIQANG